MVEGFKFGPRRDLNLRLIIKQLICKIIMFLFIISSHILKPDTLHGGYRGSYRVIRKKGSRVVFSKETKLKILPNLNITHFDTLSPNLKAN